MNIALDFDDTYTADVRLWPCFIAHAAQLGHKVYIVTCRKCDAENVADVLAVTGLPRERHVFTCYEPKREFCEARGLKIDIWIDDHPEGILYGR